MGARPGGRGTYGRMFAVCALAPVEHARMELAAGRTAAGVAELAHDSLRAGLRLAIDLVARRSGARVSDIEALLPMAELAALLDRVAKTQPAAFREAGGLAAEADSADSMAPVSLRLSDLASRSEAPGAGGTALGALAEEVERWERALSAACAGLDAAPVFVALERRKRAQLLVGGVAICVGAGLLALYALAPALARRAAHERVGAALARTDPCAVGALADSDLEAATEPEREEVASRFQRCGSEALRARKAAYLEKRAAAQRAERERKAREREAACAALADRVEAGALVDADAPVAGEAASLLSRAAAKALVAGDFEEAAPALPCEGTAAEPRLATALVKAYGAASPIWAGLDDLPPRVVALLGSHGDALEDRDRRALAWRAEEVAERAARPEAARLVPGAARLCSLKAALGFELGVPCRNLPKPSP